MIFTYEIDLTNETVINDALQLFEDYQINS